MLGGLSFATRSALAAGRLAADAVGDLVGAPSLPCTKSAIDSRDVVENLLTRFAPESGRSLPPVRDVRLPGVDFESSNCTNFLIEIDFEAEATGANEALPRTLYAKLPCEEVGTRLFANTLGFWPLEVHFCRHLAHQLPIRVPRVHVAARRGARFVLLLENIHEIPGARLFLNRDMAAGTTPERAEGVLRAFASMHAHFWALPAREREALIPERFDSYRGKRWRRVTPAMHASALGPARNAAPEIVDDAIVRLIRTATGKWDRLLARWYTGPLTLVHGDSHLGNCFEYPGEDGTRVGLIDFQAVHWSHGLRDVQYFLINSMEPDLLAEHEERLIRIYCEALATRGVDLAFEEARRHYRAFAYQTLMAGVVPLGLATLTERDETVLAVARRSAAAAARLELQGFMDSL